MRLYRRRETGQVKRSGETMVAVKATTNLSSAASSLTSTTTPRSSSMCLRLRVMTWQPCSHLWLPHSSGLSHGSPQGNSRSVWQATALTYIHAQRVNTRSGSMGVRSQRQLYLVLAQAQALDHDIAWRAGHAADVDRGQRWRPIVALLGLLLGQYHRRRNGVVAGPVRSHNQKLRQRSGGRRMAYRGQG